MKKQFWKKYKWILPVIIVCILITTCTAYGKEDEENVVTHEDNIVYEKAKAIEFENRYRILNRDIFGNKTMIPWYSDETKQKLEKNRLGGETAKHLF